jgi:hypothetical protein
MRTDFIEIEAVESLAGQELSLGKMACEAAAVAFGNLVLSECSRQPRRRPAFLVGPFGKARPVLFDGGRRRSLSISESRAASMPLV